jgi:nucleoside-diphosphate-sugar epimerase
MSYAVLHKGCGEVYNVGGVSRVQIKDIAKIVSEETGAKLTYPTNDANYLKGAPTDVSLDLTKILSLCGQRDFVDFHTGIRKTILWQKNQVY